MWFFYALPYSLRVAKRYLKQNKVPPRYKAELKSISDEVEKIEEDTHTKLAQTPAQYMESCRIGSFEHQSRLTHNNIPLESRSEEPQCPPLPCLLCMLTKTSYEKTEKADKKKKTTTTFFCPECEVYLHKECAYIWHHEKSPFSAVYLFTNATARRDQEVKIPP
jgi:hypothetical protein